MFDEKDYWRQRHDQDDMPRAVSIATMSEPTSQLAHRIPRKQTLAIMRRNGFREVDQMRTFSLEGQLLTKAHELAA